MPLRKELKEIQSIFKHHYVLDGIPNGGTTDAARHIYWMDRTSQKIRPRKALKPAEAHQMANERNFRKHKSPIQDSVAVVMDLYNKKSCC